MAKGKKKYEVVYLVNENYGKLPTFDTKEEGYAFINGLTWHCKISPDEHPCESCNAEFEVFEVEPLESISEEKYPICTYCNNTTDGEEDEKGVPICESCIIQKAEEKAREDIKSLEPLQNGERERVEQILDYYVTKSDCYTYNSIVSQKRRKMLKSEIEDLLSQSKKEGDIASDFLYWHPIGGGFPDQSIKIGVAFEPCSGCYEDFGFIIEKDGKRISAGISLKDAISKARMELDSLSNQSKDEK